MTWLEFHAYDPDHAYDPETTGQSSEPRIPRQSRSKIKMILTVFFDYRGVVHYEFIPTRQTVNKEYYLSVMRHLHEAIRKKRPELWANNSWILHHDNASTSGCSRSSKRKIILRGTM